jgi:hypothetical protein
MIEDRRALADALANEYEGGHTERMRVNFTAAQNTIEAFAHEMLIARGRLSCRYLPNTDINSRSS